MRYVFAVVAGIVVGTGVSHFMTEARPLPTNIAGAKQQPGQRQAAPMAQTPAQAGGGGAAPGCGPCATLPATITATLTGTHRLAGTVVPIQYYPSPPAGIRWGGGGLPFWYGSAGAVEVWLWPCEVNKSADAAVTPWRWRFSVACTKAGDWSLHSSAELTRLIIDSCAPFAAHADPIPCILCEENGILGLQLR